MAAQARRRRPPGPSLDGASPSEIVAARHDLVMAADTGLVDSMADSGGPQAHRVSVAARQTDPTPIFSGGGPFQVQRPRRRGVYDRRCWEGPSVSHLIKSLEASCTTPTATAASVGSIFAFTSKWFPVSGRTFIPS